VGSILALSLLSQRPHVLSPPLGARRAYNFGIINLRRILTVVLAILATSCGGGNNSPTSPACVNVAGTWTGTSSNSCQQTGAISATITQSGCSFTAGVAGQGTLTGTASGGSGTFTMTWAPPCSGTATGTATLSPNTINGTYSGRAIGVGCCDPISGSFTLTR
jgi:hypothetical protein